MGQVAGVANDGGDEGPLFGEHCARPVDALEFFAGDPLRFEPGTQNRNSSYGLGWGLETVTISGKPTAAVGHNGALLGGMAVSLMILPEHAIVVAVASNISYAATDTIALKIARAFAR